MYQGRTLQEMAKELDRQSKVKRDFLLTPNTLTLSESGDSVNITNAGFNSDFGVTENFHTQLANVYKIPAKYYKLMQSENPELLALNVNSWFGKDSDTRMIRTLDGNARAFLSNKYRCIDNYEIAQTVLPIIGSMPDAKVESCEVTDSHMYIKVVNPRIEAEVKPGDVVQSGIVIRNSEVGLGSVFVAPLIYRLVCTNGMIANDAGMRKYHVGRINEESLDLFSDETLRADNKALMLKIADVVKAAVDETRFENIIAQMRDATEVKMTGSPKTVVELTGERFNMTKDEQENVLDHLIAGHDLSLYGLSNAITRASQDVNSYERATELESMGWDVLTMSESTWKSIDRKRKPVTKKK